MEVGPILRALLTNKPRLGLIAMQIAATFAIVTNCVALVLDARGKLNVASGLDDDHLLGIWVEIPLPRSRSNEERNAWMRPISEGLRNISGVQSLSRSNFRPWRCATRDLVKPAHTNIERLPAGHCGVDEFLPETLGLVLDEGRWYTHNEVYGETNNLVITRSLARKLFGDGSVLGKVIEDFNGNLQTVIGVVQDPQQDDARLDVQFDHGEDTRCGMFAPYVPQHTLVLRVESGKTEEVTTRIEQFLEGRYARIGARLETFAAIRENHFGKQHTLVVIMGSLAILLLFIAALGIAGLTSFSVTERTRQIGIRRALGATTNDILRYFLTETVIITALGLVKGSLLAVLLNIAILRIYDSAKLSAPIVAGSALLLWVVALGAAFPPALRASRISPAIATRNV